MLHMVENNFLTILRQKSDNPIELTRFHPEIALKGIG